jgi:hypothetical protein
MATTPTIYLPVDRTGLSAANRVSLELHSVSARDLRVLKLNFGPYFARSLELFSVSTTGVLSRLNHQTQYLCVEFLDAETEQLGQEVCGAILVLDKTLPVTFSATYQALGGSENADYATVAGIVENLDTTGALVDWDDILDKPSRFTPTRHVHDASNFYGLEYTEDALLALAQSLSLSSTDAELVVSAMVAQSKHTTMQSLFALLDTPLFDLKIDSAEKGRAYGVAPLDADGAIPERFSTGITDNPYNYDFKFSLNGKPALAQTLLRVIAVRQFEFRLNLLGSLAYCSEPALLEFVVDVLKNDVVIGTLTYPVGSNRGSFKLASIAVFDIGDLLELRCKTPRQDDGLSDLSISLHASA